MPHPRQLAIGQCATLACLLEVSAPKPGNVHRGADFEDMTLTDFLVSATAIGPCMEAAAANGVGPTVLSAIQATRQVTPVNTNLGMVLLMAPLACVPRDRPLAEGITDALRTLSPEDARQVYEAIRLANPGGLGRVANMDVAAEPPSNLLAAMQSAASRDMIARQYTNDFRDVLKFVVPRLIEGHSAGWPLATATVHAYLETLAAFPDSLIARKCGPAIAQQATDMAADALAVGQPGDDAYEDALADLDFWLRADGHRRNPGTTADLIAASLFAALREGLLLPPLR